MRSRLGIERLWVVLGQEYLILDRVKNLIIRINVYYLPGTRSFVVLLLRMTLAKSLSFRASCGTGIENFLRVIQELLSRVINLFSGLVVQLLPTTAT